MQRGQGRQPLAIDTSPQPGDRIEVFPDSDDQSSRLSRAELEAAFGCPIRHLTAPDGSTADIIDGSFVLPALPTRAGQPSWFAELVSSDKARLQPVSVDEPLPDDVEGLDLLDAPTADFSLFELSLRALHLSSRPGFDQLLSVPLLRDLTPLEHQVRTVKTVLQRMRGRAMLCDEVGLGKTIEAGMTLLELMSRGLARDILVLTPPSLIEQWKSEMLRKFGVELTGQDDVVATTRNRTGWCASPRVIASIHTAKREPYRSALLERKWDLVIIDEAHHLRNRGTQTWKFASELRKQFILLLTATPVQNNLEELFNLVTLLEPGLLSTRKDFLKRFVDRRDAMTPRNVDDLHGLLAEVMVRNRRSTVGIRFTNRFARTIQVVPSDDERSLYDELSQLVRGQLSREEGPLNRMTLLTLQMALGSSAPAVQRMLENLLGAPRLPPDLFQSLDDLRDRAARIQDHAKLDQLVSLANEFGDKLVVFTQFRATQDLINRTLTDHGIPTVVFHGGLSRLEKEAAVSRFHDDARVLVCTESGSEGRNLQFANGLCNYDLPWNPMRIEQRIGRLSRIGQSRDVHVFNLVAVGTVEQSVLHLLEAKLNMFELVIGEIDMILGQLDDEKELPEVIADLWAQSRDRDEFSARMELLGNQLLAAKLAYFRQRSKDDALFGDRFAPDTA